jgi:hypothetical protein
MKTFPIRLYLILVAALALGAWCSAAGARTLCVNPSGSHGCYAKIQDAVNHASVNDVILVARGTYKEYVVVGKPLSLIGGDDGNQDSENLLPSSSSPSAPLEALRGASAVIDATGLPHGIFVDGVDSPGLGNVTIAGFTVKNALFEGVLVVNASDVTIRDNNITDNDKSPGLNFTGATTGCPNQPGIGVYENDETGDCGGALHLVGTVESIVSGNFMSGNADGILISDETGESRDNLLIHNNLDNNPLECGIVLASHPRTSTGPFAAHYGVDHNTVAENISKANGVQIGGSGVGLFSDGNGPGRVAGNLIIGNTLTGNGLGGVDIHTHVGPAFGAPADNMDGNMIIGNSISRNLADTADTATPGPVGININSGDGGSPIRGTIVSHNVINEEAVDIAVNTPAEVDIHLNDLLGGETGVADVCALDKATICTGVIDGTQNFWGCPAGPGGDDCSTVSGSDIRFDPWLRYPVLNISPGL